VAALADDTIEQIKARLSCIDVAQHLGVRLSARPGKADQRQAHCWNTAGHKNGDRNPSLSLWREGWKCHGCGEKGDVLKLWERVRRVDFKTALDELASLAGVERAGSKGTWRPRIVPPPAAPQTQHRAVDVISVPAVRAEIGARLWRIVEPLELTPGARRWLTARDIRPEAAHALGCRDWHPAADEVRAVLASYNSEDRVLAGFSSNLDDTRTPDQQVDDWWHERPSPARSIAWKPLLKALGADEARHGLMVPEWHLEHPDGPVSWRLRPYQPWGKRKTEAQPGSALRHLPLGLDLLAQCAAHDEDSGGQEPFVVVVCEGETDWLATFDASQRLLDRAPGAPYVVPIGYCAMSSPWPDSIPYLTELLTRARRVVVGFDEGHGEEPNGLKRARDIRNSIARAAGRERAKELLKVRLTREGRDLADMHRAGELVDWLAERLEV